MNTIILIKLIAAHLTGDFLFQSDRMCANKFSNNTTAKYKVLILHVFIQAALAYAFVSQWNCWVIPVVIGVSHESSRRLRFDYINFASRIRIN